MLLRIKIFSVREKRQVCEFFKVKTLQLRSSNGPVMSTPADRIWDSNITKH